MIRLIGTLLLCFALVRCAFSFELEMSLPKGPGPHGALFRLEHSDFPFRSLGQPIMKAMKADGWHGVFYKFRDHDKNTMLIQARLHYRQILGDPGIKNQENVLVLSGREIHLVKEFDLKPIAGVVLIDPYCSPAEPLSKSLAPIHFARSRTYLIQPVNQPACSSELLIKELSNLKQNPFLITQIPFPPSITRSFKDRAKYRSFKLLFMEILRDLRQSSQ